MLGRIPSAHLKCTPVSCSCGHICICIATAGIRFPDHVGHVTAVSVFRTSSSNSSAPSASRFHHPAISARLPHEPVYGVANPQRDVMALWIRSGGAADRSFRTGRQSVCRVTVVIVVAGVEQSLCSHCRVLLEGRLSRGASSYEMRYQNNNR